MLPIYESDLTDDMMPEDDYDPIVTGETVYDYDGTVDNAEFRQTL